MHSFSRASVKKVATKRGIKTMGIYSFTVLEGSSLKSWC